MCLDMPSPGMQRLFRLMGRMQLLIDSTVHMALQQCVVEHEEHKKAQKKLESVTASGSDARRLYSCLASGNNRLRKRECEVDSVLPRNNPVCSACHLNLSAIAYTI